MTRARQPRWVYVLDVIGVLAIPILLWVGWFLKLLGLLPLGG